MVELLRDKLWARALAAVAGCWAFADIGARSLHAPGMPPLTWALALDREASASWFGRLLGNIAVDRWGGDGLLLLPVQLVVACLILAILEERGYLTPAAGRATRLP